MAEESYIELYDGANYGGDKYVLHESDDALWEFNDKASSFKVSDQEKDLLRKIYKIGGARGAPLWIRHWPVSSDNLFTFGKINDYLSFPLLLKINIRSK